MLNLNNLTAKQFSGQNHRHRLRWVALVHVEIDIGTYIVFNAELPKAEVQPHFERLNLGFKARVNPGILPIL